MCSPSSPQARMPMSDAASIRCPHCDTTNRVPRAKLEQGLKAVCGRCKQPLPAAPAAAPLTVTDATFAAEVERSPLPVLVDAWAPWCGPCRMIAPALEELATEPQARLGSPSSTSTITRRRRAASTCAAFRRCWCWSAGARSTASSARRGSKRSASGSCARSLKHAHADAVHVPAMSPARHSLGI